MNDATKVREAAERLRNGEYVYEPRAVLFHFSRSRMNDVCTLADAYISLTDPTPLTLERLVEAGFKLCRIDGHFSRGRLEAARIGKGFDFWVGDTPLQLPPRTVGHLRQLLLRMKEQS